MLFEKQELKEDQNYWVHDGKKNITSEIWGRINCWMRNEQICGFVKDFCLSFALAHIQAFSIQILIISISYCFFALAPANV